MKTILLKELLEIMRYEKVNLIDVRSKEEFNNKNVKPSINYVLNEIQSWASKLKKDETYYLICAGGVRSALACEMLHNAGFENVINVEDGLTNHF